MNETITIPAETWAELKAHITALESLVGYMGYDLLALIEEVEDANTRARYMALAADDQLPLFAGDAD